MREGDISAAISQPLQPPWRARRQGGPPGRGINWHHTCTQGFRGCRRPQCCSREPRCGNYSCPTSEQGCVGQQQLWVMLVPEQPRSRSPAPRSHPASPVHAHTQVCKPKHHCVHAHAGGFPALHPGTICAHAHARRRVCNTWAPSCVRGHTRVPPREPRCGLGTPLCSMQACAGVFAPRVLAPSLVLAPGAAKVGVGVSWRHVSKLSQQHRCGCAGGGGDTWVSLPPRSTATPCLEGSGARWAWVGSAFFWAALQICL